MMNPSLRQSKWIYDTYDLEPERGSYGILKMLRLQHRRFRFGKSKSPVFTDQTQIRVKIFIVFGYNSPICRKGYV
jgi:hypothetical protein